MRLQQTKSSKVTGKNGFCKKQTSLSSISNTLISGNHIEALCLKKTLPDPEKYVPAGHRRHITELKAPVDMVCQVEPAACNALEETATTDARVCFQVPHKSET